MVSGYLVGESVGAQVGVGARHHVHLDNIKVKIEPGEESNLTVVEENRYFLLQLNK